jgi:hypothetical protein
MKSEVGFMAKGKYKEWLTEESLLRLEAWARDGLTDEQIADNIGIRRETLYDWKKKYPHISNALKRGKDVVDIQVENALLNKAQGITKTLIKPIKIKTVTYDNGKRVKEEEHIEYAEEEVFVPPDTVAQIFWLKNRKPNTWKDKPVDNEGQQDNTVRVILERR